MAGKTGALTKDNPARIQRDTTIAELSAQGKSMKQIGQAVDLDKSQVCRILQREEVQEKVNLSTSRCFEEMPGLTEELINVGYRRNGSGERDKTISISNQLRAIEDVADITEIRGAHAEKRSNVFIRNNVYQDNRVQILAPHIQTIVDKYIDDVIDGEVID